MHISEKNEIELLETTLRWDIEYWQQYLYSLKSSLIYNQTQADIDEARSFVATAKKTYAAHIIEHAEYFI